MSIYQCNACGRLTEAVNVERNGSRCGVRLSGSTWCQGTYNEHGCGGPKEACGAEGCQECGGSRATSDIDLHAKVARLTAEVERLKGRNDANRPLAIGDVITLDGEVGMVAWVGSERCRVVWSTEAATSEPKDTAIAARAAWLAGCKS